MFEFFINLLPWLTLILLLLALWKLISWGLAVRRELSCIRTYVEDLARLIEGHIQRGPEGPTGAD